MCLISETWGLICLGSPSPRLGRESSNSSTLINTSSTCSLEKKSIIYLTIFLNPFKFACILAWSSWLSRAVSLTTGPKEASGKTVLLCALSIPIPKQDFVPLSGKKRHFCHMFCSSEAGKFEVYFCPLLVFRPLLETEGADASQNSNRILHYSFLSANFSPFLLPSSPPWTVTPLLIQPLLCKAHGAIR